MRAYTRLLRAHAATARCLSAGLLERHGLSLNDYEALYLLARADGRYPKLLRDYAKTQLLILDDWGLAPLTAEGRRDLLELLEDRYNHQSTVVTSQLPVAAWHAYLNEPTLADAILDRVLHNAYRIELSGDSLRKVKKKP